mgnify:CR=1 FL=1
MKESTNLDVKSIRFSIKVDEKMNQLSLKLGRSKKELFAQMVDYFYRTKKDPIDLNDEMLKKEITSGISKIISFYRQQENDLLIPQFETVNNLDITINTLIENHEQTLDKLSRISGENQSISINLNQFQKRVQDKKELKSRFRIILESYIASRDSLGWNASAKSRDEIKRIALDSLFDL